VAINLRTDKER